MKILHLVLKRQWYELIESGKKREEYRDITRYWVSRLIDPKYLKVRSEWTLEDLWKLGAKQGICIDDYIKHYTHVCFHEGYTSKTMTFQIESISIGYGRCDWGAPASFPVFRIRLKRGILIQTL